MDTPAVDDDPVAAAAGLARLQHALFGQRRTPPRLARYLLLQRLSAGGMGVVYRAYDPTLDRPVAVKLVETRDPQAAERSLAEAHALAALTHPNVVRIFDVGTYDVTDVHADPEVAQLLPTGGIFLVLELVEGDTLAQWVAAGPRDWTEVRDAYVQAGRGLMAAHAQGLVHHDFKPANAVRGDDGRVRVLDFGLAREAASSDGRRSEDGDPGYDPGLGVVTQAGDATRAAGTPAYMAPEQHDGTMTGPATDQFAFCVALYEALYGRRPYAGNDIAALSEAKRRGGVQVPSGAPVPGWIGRLVLRGLEVDPADRWPSMAALVRELQRDQVRAQRLRRSAGVGLAIAAIAGIVGVRQVMTAEPRDDCAAPAQGLDGIWDEGRRDQARRAFGAVSRRYAARTFSMASDRLDTYRDQWIEHMGAMCDDQAPLDEELRALGRVCLQQRRRELGAVVDVLVRADEGVVDHAQATVSSLRPLSGCIEPTRLVMEMVLPEDPQRRAAVEEAQAELARANALRYAGRIGEVKALAESALARAEVLDYSPLRADALRHVAQARIAAGDEQGGLQALRDSVAVALLNNNHWSAGRSWMDLLYDEANAGSGYRAALELVPVAERAVERARDSALHTAWLTSLGAVHLLGYEAERGLAALQQADELRDEDYGAHRTLRLMENLALAHAHLGNWETAEAMQRELLGQIQELLGEEHPDEAIALLNFSAVQLQLGRPGQAQTSARRAIDILRSVYGHHPYIVNALTNIAETHYVQGDVDQARAVAEAAIEESDQVEGGAQSSGAGALDLLADLEDMKGNLEQARDYRRRGLALAERQHGPDHPYDWVGRLHLARLDTLLGEEAPARATLERARVALRQRPEGLDDRRWCFILAQLGELHAMLGSLDAGIADYERAVRCADDRSVGLDHRALHRQGLAEILVERDRPRAVSLMQEALADLSPHHRAQAQAWLEEHAGP